MRRAFLRFAFAVCCVLTGSAWGVTTYSPEIRYWTMSPSGPQKSSAVAACQAFPYGGQPPYTGYSKVDRGGSTSDYQGIWGQCYYNASVAPLERMVSSIGVGSFCNFGGTATWQGNAQICVGAPDCPYGQHRDPNAGNSATGGQCVPDSSCAALAGKITAQYGCVNGCQATLVIPIDGGGGGASAYGEFTGQSCVAGDGLPSPPQPCGHGQFPGTVTIGGVEKAICVDGGSGGPCPYGGVRNAVGQCTYPNGPPTPADSNGSTSGTTGGTTSGTTSGGSSGSSGSSSGTTTGGSSGSSSGGTSGTTSGDTSGTTGGSTSGTTTGGTSGTSSGGTSGTGETPSFCSENPNSPICKEHTASGGSECDSAPSCDGDPIMCAQLQQAWLDRCALFQKRGEPATDHTELEKKDIPLSFNPMLVGSGSSSCPADIPLPHGASFSFAPLCQYASALRPIIILLAWLSAASIIFGWRSD